MGETFEQHSHDKDGFVCALIRNAGNLAQIFYGMVICSGARLKMECGFQEAEGINPVNMFITENVSVVSQYSSSRQTHVVQSVI
jgi:hypothetical protein